MADTTTGINLIGYCEFCGVQRYKSRQPITGPEECTAANFEGVNGTPDPQVGTVPLCAECNNVVKFITEEQFGRLNSRPVPRDPAVGPANAAPASRTPRGSVGVSELFSLQPGEEIKGMKDAGPTVIIFTNKRVVKLDLAALGV